LREDYLAHLEGLKGLMPSITQNRMRLARMTGQQALRRGHEAGRQARDRRGGGIDRALRRRRLGAAQRRGGAVAALLVCRELNNARLAQGRSEISADLMAGSRETILSEFYERALADQPEGVRRFIEDEMLTESGFRESIAEERALRAFAAAGAASDALSTLVNRRLLRIEERLDLRRVELTHDVLCAVVIAKPRLEARARGEGSGGAGARSATGARSGDAQGLVRARQVAAGCACPRHRRHRRRPLRLREHEACAGSRSEALQTRTMAESARGEAEKLIVYLLDDFYLELEPVGRLDIVADLSRRALDYYSGLPPELRTPETERNRALAQVRLGYVLRYQARIDEAGKVLAEANATLANLRKQGDASEIAAIGHALGLSAQARVIESQGRLTDAAPLTEQSAQVLQPLMAAPTPSMSLRRAFGAVNNYLGFVQVRTGKVDLGVKTLELTRETFPRYRRIAGRDLASAAGYAEASAWLMEALEQSGRSAESRRVGEEAFGVASRVLEKRPGHMGRCVRGH
jgi:hypothetical protein